MLVLSNYLWLRGKLKHTGGLFCLPSNFHVSLRLSSNSFRFSEAAEEVEKQNQGYLFDQNSFDLKFGDFMELLSRTELVEEFVPGLLKRKQGEEPLELTGVKRKLIFDSEEAAQRACGEELDSAGNRKVVSRYGSITGGAD